MSVPDWICLAAAIVATVAGLWILLGTPRDHKLFPWEK
jgi:hypothetical protein